MRILKDLYAPKSLEGRELVLDADGDTTITADTDDQIDVKISGADDFQFTANTFTALSGSTVAIASGATIANSGTATGFGADAERAVTGVLETNANFVDQVIFGPSVDGQAWNGKWSVASLYSSLMLATIEDTGADTEVNIWDLTEQSGGAIDTTALGTVTLSGDATPTSVAACMGYIIVGSEDGISIIDPHSGAWAERTTGWPRSLSTSTTPALAANDINQVLAFVAEDNPFDPLTGGKIPYFVAGYESGTTIKSIIMPNGAVYEDTYSSAYNLASAEMYPGIVVQIGSGNVLSVTKPLANTTADANLQQFGIGTTDAPGCPTGVTCGDGNGNGTTVFGGTAGLDRFLTQDIGQSVTDAGSGESLIRATTDRTYTTGFQVGDIRGAWLANSATADRSYKANTLTENGTVTEAAVESGAELLGYNDFSAANYLTDAFDADFDFGTGSFSLSFWAKANGTGAGEYWLFGRHSASHFWYIQFRGNDSDKFRLEVSDGSNAVRASSSGGNDDNTWHHIVGVFDSSGATDEGRIYRDGVLEGTHVQALNTVTDPDGEIGIGARPDGNGSAGGVTLALARVSATVPTATQIRQMYDAEKGMFEANAECLLQSGSTDAVLDVNVDPLTNKVLVTQTDAITVFDGLVVDSKPTVNSGSSEKGKLWGDLRAEQNSANAYVTAPAVDQRQVNEMVRGLASDLPKGVDLSKAKVLVQVTSPTTINFSLNVKSITYTSTGRYVVTPAIPFKSGAYTPVGTVRGSNFGNVLTVDNATPDGKSIQVFTLRSDTDALLDANWGLAVFGELENE